MERFGLSERYSCELVDIGRSSHRYQVLTDPHKDDALRKRMREVAENNRRWGCPLIHDIVKREGLVENHKRTERIYREEGLIIRKRKRKRHGAAANRVERPKPTAPNQSWSMDFMSDCLETGRKLRLLNVVDDFTRECLAIVVDTSISGLRVSRTLDDLIAERSKPASITTDNGPEFTSRALDSWAFKKGVKINYIRPGKPNENAYIESFNGRFRDECLNENWFSTIPETREITERWRDKYNFYRPHSSLNRIPPKEFAKQFVLN